MSNAEPQTALPSPNDHQRRVRLAICRAADALVAAVSEIEDNTGITIELQNMVYLAQRIALRLNDGHVSPSERIRTW